MGDFPIGDPHCPDCHGTGRYQGLGAAEPCRTCEKKEGDNASLEDALEFGDLVEDLFPGAQDEPGGSAIRTRTLPVENKYPTTKLDPDGSELKVDSFKSPWDHGAGAPPPDGSELVNFRPEVMILDDPDEGSPDPILTVEQLNKIFEKFWEKYPKGIPLTLLYDHYDYA